MCVFSKHLGREFTRIDQLNIFKLNYVYFSDKLDLLQEKEFSIPDELGKDAQSVAALQRRHANFEHDLLTLGAQV